MTDAINLERRLPGPVLEWLAFCSTPAGFAAVMRKRPQHDGADTPLPERPFAGGPKRC